MDTEYKSKHTIDTVFVICLTLLFLLSALSVIAIGASIYQKNVTMMASNSSQRIATSYISEKVRQNDINGAVYVDELFGKNALVMAKEVNGSIYNTYIYEYDGQLMELFARSDLGTVYPQSGQKIMDVRSFDIKDVSDGLFDVRLVLEDGLEEQIYISKRSNRVN